MCAKKTLWIALKKRCFFLKKPFAACTSPVKGVYGGFDAVLRGGGHFMASPSPDNPLGGVIRYRLPLLLSAALFTSLAFGDCSAFSRGESCCDVFRPCRSVECGELTFGGCSVFSRSVSSHDIFEPCRSVDHLPITICQLSTIKDTGVVISGELLSCVFRQQ